MLSVSTARIVADRLDVFLEIEAITKDINRIEHAYGHLDELDDYRHRVQRVRQIVLGQLRALLDALETVH